MLNSLSTMGKALHIDTHKEIKSILEQAKLESRSGIEAKHKEKILLLANAATVADSNSEYANELPGGYPRIAVVTRASLVEPDFLII